MSIKAIETRYKGYRFRSRLEARWAVFFDALKIAWEYEPQGFDLGELGCYLPDFWLPEWGCWAEVKPEEPSCEEVRRLEALADETDHPAVFLIGTPREDAGPRVYCSDTTDSSGGTGWWDEETDLDWGCYWSIGKDGHPCICSNNDFGSRSFFSPGWGHGFSAMKLVRECWLRGELFPIKQAVQAARGARFEHGETPE